MSDSEKPSAFASASAPSVSASSAASSSPPAPVSAFIVNEILPTREIHLIYGPSGAGKTTLALQLLDDLAGGRDVLGFEPGSPGAPPASCYVACSRSNAELESHMRALALDPSAIPHLSMCDVPKRSDSTAQSNRNFAEAFTRAKRLVPNLRVLFLDGLATLCPGKINDNQAVSEFLTDIKRVCKADLTVIGIVLAPKAREGEGYTVLRDRISGAANWSEFTGTKILVDFSNPRDARDTSRTVALLPQRCAGASWLYSFTGARLTLGRAPTAHAGLFEWVATVPPGTSLTTAQLIQRGESLGMSESTVRRWITEQVELGMLVRKRHGVYEIPVPAAAS